MSLITDLGFFRSPVYLRAYIAVGSPVSQNVNITYSRILDSQNFKIKSFKYVITEEILKSGEYTTNCLICNATCHFPCFVSQDDDKAECSAMKDKQCQQCKCIWSAHKNMPFRFISKQQEVNTELAELKKQFLDNKSTKTHKEQILDGIEEQYMQQQIDCMEMQQKLMLSVNTLKQIALQPGCCQFQEDYVEIMISEEMFSKKEGYFNRITELQEIKSNWKCIREFSNDQGGVFVTKQLIEQYIPKEKIKKSLFQKVNLWYSQWQK